MDNGMKKDKEDYPEQLRILGRAKGGQGKQNACLK